MQPVVYYADADYLGVMRRLLIDFVDTGVAVFASIVSGVLAMVVFDEVDSRCWRVSPSSRSARRTL